jgi:uncharacterized membrane protein YkvA (DUF1232 family)
MISMTEQRLEIDLRARERRLYDRLRAQVVTFEPGAASGFRDLLLLVPDLVVLLARLLRDPRVPAGSKLIALLGVFYVASPLDLMPELIFGPFGLADDLIVLAAALSRILNRVHPDLVRSHWPGHGDALDSIRRLSGWAESRVGGTLARLLGFRKA